MDPRLLAQARNALFLTNWRLHMVLPSVLATGETCSLRITAYGPDDLPSGDFDREITFTDSPQIEGLPERVRIPPEGQLTLEGLRATAPGTAWVAATVEGAPAPVLSNPAWVFDEPPYRIYWGDLHVHTTYSNCSPWACKDPAFCYALARDVAHLDFAAAADHLRGIASDPTRWPRLQELVRSEEQAGAFVPFLAFESSHKTGFGGDINAYFRDPDAPYFWLDREDMKGAGPAVTLQQLWDFLDGTGEPYFTVPHHTGRAGKYRDFSDPVYDGEREPLFEIYSGWGSSEARWTRYPLRGGNSDRPCYLQDALRQGCRYGVIASSDSHTTMVGGETGWRLPLGHKHLAWHHHHGLTAVRAPELDRERLWEGFTSRQCFATTYVRSLVDMHVGDVPMGGAAPIGRDDPLRAKREICVHYAGTEPGGRTVTLVRNGEELARAAWTPEQPTIVFEDAEALDAIALREAPFHPEPFAVYYVRVEHGQGQAQWSSPVWLDLA